jgi:hypothetical protein
MKNTLIFLACLALTILGQNSIVFATQRDLTKQKNLNLSADTTIDLRIVPSATSSEKDFDFFFGKWTVQNKTLYRKSDNSLDWREFVAADSCSKILFGIGNIDFFSWEAAGKPIEGMSLRVFNPTTKLWSIYWVDSRSAELGTPVVGSFDKGIGTFLSDEVINGANIRNMYKWDITNPNKPEWSQSISRDGGKTWRINWYMHFLKTS